MGGSTWFVLEAHGAVYLAAGATSVVIALALLCAGTVSVGKPMNSSWLCNAHCNISQTSSNVLQLTMPPSRSMLMSIPVNLTKMGAWPTPTLGIYRKWVLILRLSTQSV